VLPNEIITIITIIFIRLIDLHDIFLAWAQFGRESGPSSLPTPSFSSAFPNQGPGARTVRAGSIGRERDWIVGGIFHPPEEAGSFFPPLPRRNQRLGAKRTVQASGPRPKCWRRTKRWEGLSSTLNRGDFLWPRSESLAYAASAPIPKRKKLGGGTVLLLLDFPLCFLYYRLEVVAHANHPSAPNQ